MSGLKKTLSAVVTALFPNSVQPIAEKLNTEEFNAFAGDADELHNRLSAQQTGNEQVVADLATARARVVELEAQTTAGAAATERVVQLETELATTQAALLVFGADDQARADYKAQADLALRQAENLRNAGVPPTVDASTAGTGEAKSYEQAPWNGHLQTA